MSYKIAVMMSTYNGEKYIRDQIESILNQKNVDVTLYIRDDCSTDSTNDIINSYMKNNNNIILLNDSQNVGPGLSFMLLLKEAYCADEIYDYYAFADQDDIWFDEKLSKAVEKIVDYQEPILYCSNQTLYRNGESLGMKFESEPEISLIRSVSSNDFAGCTMVMNKELVKIIIVRGVPEIGFLKSRNHDAWIYMIASVEGKVVYDPNSYMLYRLHENNVVGISKINAPFKERVKKIFTKESKNVRCRSAQYLLKAYDGEEFEGKEYVDLMANYRGSVEKKFKLIKYSSIIKNKNESGIAFWAKVIINYL